MTWLIRPTSTGTTITITLVVDEPDAPATIEDAEDTWLPILGARQQHLKPKETTT